MTVTVPVVGSSSPVIMRIVVDFTARWAQESGDDAGLNHEAELVDGQLLPVSLAEVLDFDHRVAFHVVVRSEAGP